MNNANRALRGVTFLNVNRVDEDFSGIERVGRLREGDRIGPIEISATDLLGPDYVPAP